MPWVRLKRTAQAESDSVFDNRLNVPVVRLNFEFRVRAISQERAARFRARAAIVPFYPSGDDIRFQTRV